MICLLSAKEMKEKSDIDEDEVCRRIRSVKNPLKSFHICSVYTMVYWGSSPKTPIRKIRRKTEMEKDRFMEYETHQQSGKKSETCGKEENFQVL